MYANLLFLVLEAQRFRFFDVFHSRLRMIEENFYGPLLRREPAANWLDILAIGRVPGWIPAVLVLGLFAYLLVCVFAAPPLPRLADTYREEARPSPKREVPELDS